MKATTSCPVAELHARHIKKTCGKVQDRLIYRHATPAKIGLAKACVQAATDALVMCQRGRCVEAVALVEDALQFESRVSTKPTRWYFPPP